MIELLDLRTVSINTILISFFFATCMLMYAKHNPQFNGIKSVGIGFLVASIAFSLIGFRNHIPNFLSIVIPNVLTVLCVSYIHIGLARFYEFNTESIKRHHGILLVTMLASSLIFTYLENNTNIRIVIISFIISAQCCFIIRTLLQVHRLQQHTANLGIGFSFLIFALFFAVRGVMTLSEKPLINFMDAGVMHSLAIIAYQLMVISTSFSMVWIVSHRLQVDLKDQATHDPLTKVFNRRALEEILNVEHSRSMRNLSPLSIIMLDIDYFKNLNDRYGHSIGDAVLEGIAKILVRNTRGHDSVARFGGEEFILLLPETALDKAKMIAEKLRMKIASHLFLESSQSNLEVTASFGVTSCDLEKESWITVLERVDSALYLAKKGGRNKVIVLDLDNQDAESASTG
jgi:diguanylate cyclase (GGDEF)-like protein